MTNEHVWDGLAHEYAEQFHALTDWRLGYLIVENLLKGINGKKILDYGCGPGKFSRRLRDLGAFVTAVDVSTTAIQRAKQNDPVAIDYRVIQGDDISFLEKGSLDAAVANFVFCTIQQDSQIQKIVEKIYEQLKPESYFVILEPHPDALGYEYVSLKRERPKKVKSGTPIKVKLTGMDTTFYDYWRSKNDYQRIFEKSGFEIDAIREPMVKNCPDETFWKDERIQSPSLILRLRKPYFK